MDVIAYLCWDYDWTMLVKGAPNMFADNFSISVKQDGDKKPQTTFSNETYFFYWNYLFYSNDRHCDSVGSEYGITSNMR